MHMLPFQKAALCGTLTGSLESIPNANVLIGPTEDFFIHRDVWWTDNQEFWDDRLTEEEVEIICGVYKVVSRIIFYLFNYHYP